MNTLQQLAQAGQSLWYDNIQRGLLKNGEIAAMIERGEIRGVTSNPTIFSNAITKSSDYDEDFESLVRAGHSAEDIFWELAISDIQATADLFLPLYRQTNGGDGFVSLEVNPQLANDSEGTLAEVRRLWQRVNRPNLMVKIPATRAGLPAIAGALAEGININVTLIFARQRYAEVMDAHQEGLERRIAAGAPVDSIASVASFFVSRVDTKVDKQLEAIAGRGAASAEMVEPLLGKAGIANARLAYADFKEVCAAERFKALERHGARPQRPLWASTGVKNKRYPEVMYVEELIGPQTVNTVPPQTLVAFLDHGKVRLSLEEGLDEAQRVLDSLEALGVSMAKVTEELEEEGVEAFSDSFVELVEAVKQRQSSLATAV
jgi:transaldolase